MLQLHQHLVSQNHIHPKAQHTTIAGIWNKLNTLYDLPSLDEREDARQLSPISGESQDGEDEEEDVYSLAENKIHNEVFALPEEEFGDMMWKRRLPREKSESPAELPEINLAKEAPVRFEPKTTVSAEPTSSPAKKGRGRGRGGANKEKEKERPGGRRKSARQAAEESEKEDSEDDDDEEEEEESSEEEEEESGEATPAPKTGRSSGRARGRPAKGGTSGRGRGRKR